VVQLRGAIKCKTHKPTNPAPPTAPPQSFFSFIFLVLYLTVPIHLPGQFQRGIEIGQIYFLLPAIQPVIQKL